MKRIVVLLSLLAFVFVACEKDPEETSLSNHSYRPSQDPTVVTEEGLVGGAVVGIFSVSDTQRVQFSRGNLQYRAKDSKWRFAGNQFDVCGTENEHIGRTFSGWIDLFGWGTSGEGNSFPYLSSTNSSDYAPTINMLNNTGYDWGVSNEISNASVSWIWRTLSVDEWNYLLFGREGATQLHSLATVLGHKGMLLLPDGWVCPQSVNYTPDARIYDENQFDLSAWITLQCSGAVFLPATGCRTETNVNYLDEGYYWSSMGGGSSMAFYLFFRNNKNAEITLCQRYLGCSVRLVKNVD